MSQQVSLTQELKKLEKQVYSLKAARELNKLSRDKRDAVLDLRDSISTARSLAAQADSSDEARDKIMAIEQSVEQLRAVQQLILQVSALDLIGPVDVAELSAQTELITERLQKIISE